MAYDTYQDLVDSIAGYLKEDDLQSQIGDFILLFESIEGAKLRHPHGQVHLEDYPVNSATQILPADCRSVRSFGRAGKVPLTQVPFEQIRNADRRDIYAVLGTTAGQELVQPTNQVESPFEAEIVYIKKLEALANGNGNWLYENFPMLYLYGALLQAESYLEKDQRITTWNAFYQGSLEAMETDARSIEAGALQRSSQRVRSRI